ncbi:MAG: 30S ribosomal protein S2 [Candidatus Marinimicrobia bacterium]|nr:30S ribosomal protein S2 [Candidatus Neomarinimicrobiota bacterium]
MDLTFEDLLSTGAHFGHLTRKWNPNFQQYILMVKNGIHIINLEETLKGLRKAVEYVQSITSEGGDILFVGTKKNAKNIVQEEADKCTMHYVVERWLGGTLTNYSTIRKSIKRLQLLEKESSPLYENATKKEILSLEREMIRLQDLHRGIKDMKGLPDAIFVVDTNQESIAVDEAKVLNIPVIAIVDTNSNPKLIDYPIPANDDSIRAVKLIVSEISKAICESKSMAYPDGEVSIEQAVPEEDDEISNSTDIDNKSDTTGTDGKQIEELVVDSTEED